VSAREAIASALNGLSVTWSGEPVELAATPIKPAGLAVWQAFPDWQSSRWLSRCITEETWAVYVILPGSDAQAFTSATDTLIEPVRDALITLGHVSQVAPIALVSAEQSITMPALNFSLVI